MFTNCVHIIYLSYLIRQRTKRQNTKDNLQQRANIRNDRRLYRFSLIVIFLEQDFSSSTVFS